MYQPQGYGHWVHLKLVHLSHGKVRFISKDRWRLELVTVGSQESEGSPVLSLSGPNAEVVPDHSS